MILELADIRIHPGQQAAFDEAIERGLKTVISHAKGFEGFKVNKGIESPERYILQIFWATLEDHTPSASDNRRHLPIGARLWDNFSHRPLWWSTLS